MIVACAVQGRPLEPSESEDNSKNEVNLVTARLYLPASRNTIFLYFSVILIHFICLAQEGPPGGFSGVLSFEKFDLFRFVENGCNCFLVRVFCFKTNKKQINFL